MDPWVMLVNGDFFGAVLAPFTNLMGGWFYAILLFAIVGSTYLKTQNITLTGLLMIITTISMSAVLPAQIMNFVYISLIIISTVVMHKLYTKS